MSARARAFLRARARARVRVRVLVRAGGRVPECWYRNLLEDLYRNIVSFLKIVKFERKIKR